ncbi:MAG: 50S ribosomal protein L11 methyltransferase [Gemmatimonadota bacterium]
MDWLVLTLAVPLGGGHLLVDALHRCGARAVDRDGDRVLALFPPADPDDLAAEVRAAVVASTGVTPEISWSRQDPAAWEARWRAEQVSRRVGDRIVVAPAGAGLEGIVPRPEDVVIRLAPGVAFGTAEHATTRACLGLLEEHVRPGNRVLDIGTGSGVLAIGAALLGAGAVLALESDPWSCDVARRNVAANGVDGRVEVRELEVTPSTLRRLGRRDLVVANIEAAVILSLIPALPRALARGGRVILSGIVADERDPVVDAVGRAGLHPVTEWRDGSWWTAVLAR